MLFYASVAKIRQSSITEKQFAVEVMKLEIVVSAASYEIQKVWCKICHGSFLAEKCPHIIFCKIRFCTFYKELSAELESLLCTIW
jgi:hypothetical protein